MISLQKTMKRTVVFLIGQEVLNSFYRRLNVKGGRLLDLGNDEFDGYKEFLGQQLYYSHKTPAALWTDLENTGFRIMARDYREIGGETFLWVTVSKQ